MRSSQRRLVRVSVYTLDRSLLTDANARLKPLSLRAQDPIVLQYSAELSGHVAEGEVRPGTYLLTVSAADLETHSRQVEISRDGFDEVVVLGRSGLPYYYRGTAKVPYEPRPLIAVLFTEPRKVENTTNAITSRFGFEVVPFKSAGGNRVRVFRIPDDLGSERQAAVLREMTRLEGIHHAGPVLDYRAASDAVPEASVTFFTNEFIVRCLPSVDARELGALVADLKLELRDRTPEFKVRRRIPYAGNTFLVQAGDAWEGFAACDALLDSGKVVYAEPNLVVTAQNDAVNPTDFLYAKQWHIPLVNLPLAWEALQTLNGPGVGVGDPGDLTFGSESIRIAILDTGIPSETVGTQVRALHPDFKGAVTGGASKVSTYFDFERMLPNNDNPPGRHGVNCAGLAAALANNPSTTAGENEGVAGAAPNCRVMSLIRPAVESEVHYADAYYWIAGLDPESDQPGFPEPLPAGEGADVISSSFGFDINVPTSTSPTMPACFDALTMQGRNGKGTVLCFSAGNLNAPVESKRPWAAHSKTIGVAASTPADTKTFLSNYGPGIDLCAPGGDNLTLLVTCDLLGQGTLAGHTNGTLDYTHGFIGTSAATPIVAGIAALILSVNPHLTWSEVSDILCDTAEKIDLANIDPIGHWTDTDGDNKVDHSQWYGFGRVDAFAAVTRAKQTAAIAETNVPENNAPEDGEERGPEFPPPKNVPPLPPKPPC